MREPPTEQPLLLAELDQFFRCRSSINKVVVDRLLGPCIDVGGSLYNPSTGVVLIRPGKDALAIAEFVPLRRKFFPLGRHVVPPRFVVDASIGQHLLFGGAANCRGASVQLDG